MMTKIPKHKLLLALCDYLALVLSFLLAVQVRFAEHKINIARLEAVELIFIGIYALLWIAVFHHFNLYKINVFLMIVDQFIAVFKAMGYGLIGLIVASFFVKDVPHIESRLVISYFASFAFISVLFFRLIIYRPLYMFLSENRILRRRVLIVGAGTSGQTMAANIAFDSSLGLVVMGFVDDALPRGERVFESAEVLGGTGEIKELVQTHHVDEVLIVIDNISYQQLMELIDRARQTRAVVKISSQLYDVIPDKLFIEKYLGLPVVSMMQNQDHSATVVYKRAFDIIFAVIGLLILSVPLLIISLLIKLTSRGPVFFKQTRIGKDGKPFEFYKFRSMKVNNDDKMHREFVKNLIRESVGESGKQSVIGQDGKVQVRKMTNDPRITAVGSFLRKTSLDELPQLLNVLKGEMSLVGPRPCMPYEWEVYEAWHRRRLSVTPGCTGLWQVSGRSTVGFNDMVILDLYYIDNMSPLMDLKLIVKTFPVMLLAKGGY